MVELCEAFFALSKKRLLKKLKIDPEVVITDRMAARFWSLWNSNDRLKFDLGRFQDAVKDGSSLLELKRRLRRIEIHLQQMMRIGYKH